LPAPLGAATQKRLPGVSIVAGPLFDVLHLLREIDREGAWMLGFRDRGLGRVHVWVHRN